MREVLIDVTRVLWRHMRGRLPTGIDRVCLEYVRHFHKKALAVVRIGPYWRTFSSENSNRIFEILLDPSQVQRNKLNWVLVKSYVGWYSSPPQKGAILFNIGHSGLEHPDYANQIKKYCLSPLFFVHDLIPIFYPEYCRQGEDIRHQKRINTVLSLAYGVMVNSIVTLRDLESYANTYCLSIPPHVVVPLAPANLPPPTPKRPIATPYFVVLGTIEPRKNHLLLLHIWRDMVKKLGTTTPFLVIIGQHGWECEQVVDLLTRCKSLQGFVLEKSHCSDAELSTYLYHAQALLFPSFTEGFGLPVVEAISLGVPVIASDLQVLHEIVGEVPEYINPLDGIRWLETVIDYTDKKSPRRQQQLKRIEVFKLPTWAEHFAKVDKFLEDLDEYRKV